MEISWPIHSSSFSLCLDTKLNDSTGRGSFQTNQHCCSVIPQFTGGWNASLLLHVQDREQAVQRTTDVKAISMSIVTLFSWGCCNFTYHCNQFKQLRTVCLTGVQNRLCAHMHKSHFRLSTAGFPLLLIIYPSRGLNKPSFFKFQSNPPLPPSPQKPQSLS